MKITHQKIWICVGTSSLIISFIDIATLSKISRMSKTHLISVISRIKIQNIQTKIGFIGDKIIKTYEEQDVKTLNTNGRYLYSKIKLYMHCLLKYEKEWIPLWENSGNAILCAFHQSYSSHFILKNKTFVNMGVNNSFASCIMMQLYH